MSLIEVTTIAANVITSAGILGLVAFYIGYQHNQKQFRFTVMISCIERFQSLLPSLRSGTVDEETLIKYIDLTSEEFFYFQNRYIPRHVTVEWLDSIIGNFPIYSETDKDRPVNYTCLRFKDVHDANMLVSYPRIQKAMTVRGTYLFPASCGNEGMDPNQKIDLIKEIGANLGIRFKKRDFRRAMLS
ncbi:MULTISPECIES: hypothetical protein [unclassified Imperialibacter]|uniref:hypothetical protein n=1 Tax=unclassified Imperialibacter TaxID=2629706 RepID=UPI00125A9AF7|nr:MULTISPECIES: hypothetical protein [unclassified Imperialibacter]CAD5257296.1 hypothetical protein IMPERIA89_240081 [Imperialibacter sp. 89]CAD5272292.1 hypothetical protein IMPERIA75_390081 [Imperialibacter sp. 75]VVT32082.1 hypothetical protein IMPR6_60018 [Imperialibacter sp. EC-SDR9]